MADEEKGKTPETPVVPVDDNKGPDVPDFVRDPVKAYAEIQKLRQEAAANRTAAKEAADKLSKAEADKLAKAGEWEALATKRAEELEALREDLKQGAIKSAAIAEAAKVGFRVPEDAYLLGNLADVEATDGGEVKGMTAAIKALAESRPDLLGPVKNAPPAPKLPPSNPGGGPALTADALRQMSPQQIASMKPEDVRAALSRKG
jgi:hypothetical protein